MRDHLKHIASVIEEEKEHLSDAIYNEMAIVAKNNGYDEVYIGWYGNSVTVEGEETGCDEINELDDFYCDHVNAGGFQRIWKKGQGWC